MTTGYGWEKLYSAVVSLCGKGTQAERLANAVKYSLINIKPENDLPEEIRLEFQKFIDGISSMEAQGDEGTIQATVNALDGSGLSREIGKIISFYDTVCRHHEPDS